MKPETTTPAAPNPASTCTRISESPAAPPVVGLLDFLLTIPFLLAFVGTLVFFDIVQRAAYLVGKDLHSRSVLALNRALVKCLGILGTKIEVDVDLDIDPSRSYLIVCNHQSLFDIPILSSAFGSLNPKFIAKKELRRFIPSVSFNLRNGGCLTIDRSNGREAIAAISGYAKLLHSNNWTTVLFPEGTRARNGVLKEFRGAGFAALLKHMPDTEVIPAALDGSWKLAVNRYGPVPRGITVMLKAGKPICRNGHSLKEYQQQVFAAVRSLFSEVQEQNNQQQPL